MMYYYFTLHKPRMHKKMSDAEYDAFTSLTKAGAAFKKSLLDKSTEVNALKTENAELLKTIHELQASLQAARLENDRLKATIRPLEHVQLQSPRPSNKIRCDCGATIAKTSMYKHKLSAFHLANVALQV